MGQEMTNKYGYVNAINHGKRVTLELYGAKLECLMQEEWQKYLRAESKVVKLEEENQNLKQDLKELKHKYKQMDAAWLKEWDRLNTEMTNKLKTERSKYLELLEEYKKVRAERDYYVKRYARFEKPKGKTKLTEPVMKRIAAYMAQGKEITEIHRLLHEEGYEMSEQTVRRGKKEVEALWRNESG